MTAPVDLSQFSADPIPDGVPDFRASEKSGESGDPSRPKLHAPSRRRLFGSDRAAEKTDGGTSTKVAPPKLKASAKGQIEKIYLLIGGFVKPFDELTGDTIIEQAPACAETVYELAQTNDAFRAALQALMQTSLTGALIFAHLPILFAIVGKHSNNPKVKGIAIGGYMATKAGAKDSMPDFKIEFEDAE